MPRRSLEDPLKPFELRTGIGGMPPLGGIFRAGDPATVPPYKHHQAVNARITPEGLYSRPGLATVFDTGVAECIDGITEFGDGQGQALLLWPGITQQEPNGVPGLNRATFRSIFPGRSDYSEYLFVLEGQAVADAASPVVSSEWGDGTKEALSNPFIFRDAIYQFRDGIRQGDPDLAVGLWENQLAPRSNLQASDCSRAQVSPSLPTGCPISGTGPSFSGQPWPFNHPVSQSILRMECVESETAFWRLLSSQRFGIYLAEPGLSVAIHDERVDNPLDAADVGVAEVLYFILDDGAGERRVMRWDGVQLSVEHEIPDGTTPSPPDGLVMGTTAYGPFVFYQVSGAVQLSYRQADGSWADDGVEIATPLSPLVVISDLQARKAFHSGLVMTSGDFRLDVGVLTPKLIVFRFSPDANSWEFYEFVGSAEVGLDVLDAVFAGGHCYALAREAGEPAAVYSQDERLFLQSSDIGPIWIQAIGDRVYVGGAFDDGVDPVTGVWGTPGENPRHCVFDVTDFSSVELIYQVYESEQEFDGGDDPTQRYSKGCLPGIPGGGIAAEGFGDRFA